MIPPLDPFALHFDSIEIDPTRAPTQAAIEHALAFCAPADELLTTSAAAPDLESAGFYLVDDAGGRFIVDREMGVVSLKDETILSREHGAIRSARLRVVEPSGANYELELKLRLTGRVPQVVGGEDFDFGANAPTETADLASTAPSVAPVAARAPLTAWSRYTAANAAPGKADLIRTRRSFIAPDFPQLAAPLATASLTLAETLPAVGAHAPWSL